jgi:hypothetical protein
VKFLRFALILAFSLFGCAFGCAQPTCFTNYDAESYCEYARYPHIFIGRVIKLAKEDTYSMLGYKGADVEVYRTVKVSPIGSKVTVALAEGCAGRIEAGGLYLFNLNESTAGAPLRADKWSRIDGLSDAEVARVMDGLDAVIAGKDEPMLVGTVTQPDGQPFANVEVIAKGPQKKLSVTTDGDGRYVFDRLPLGEYKISVKYPLGYGPNDYYDKPRDTDERDFQARKIENWPCGTRMGFATALSAKVVGALEVDRTGWDGFPYFQLLDATENNDDGQPFFRAESGSFPAEDWQHGPIGFKFYHLTPGHFYLKMAMDRSWDRTTTFYYPGVRSLKDAKVLIVDPGTSLDLKWSLPPLRLITITGRMQLADGTRVFGGVELYDSAYPNITDTYSPADRDRDDIKFTFRTVAGRPVDLCAGYDGEKNGRQIHMYTRVHLDGDIDHENILLTLDRPIPKGVYWWDQCKK